jgi:hypothetical protein
MKNKGFKISDDTWNKFIKSIEKDSSFILYPGDGLRDKVIKAMKAKIKNLENKQ